jgi:hypothetical protein
MNPLILMGAIAALPLVLITVLRSKAAVVFLALCAGSVLTVFVGETAMEFLMIFVRDPNEITQSAIQITLLLLPALLIIMLLRGTANGATLVMNLFPAALTGILAVFLVVPLLPSGVKNEVMDSSMWLQLVNYQAVLVGSAVFISVVQLWSSSRSARHKKKGKH